MTATTVTPKYFTKDGREITFQTFFPDPQDPLTNSVLGKRKKYTIARFVPMVDGQEMGYLKLTWIPSEDWDKTFKYNMLNYIRNQGHLYNVEDPKELWEQWQPMHGMPCPDTPEERIAAVSAYLETSQKQRPIEWRADRQRTKEFAVDKPWIDYIRVYEEFRRNHIAVAMYLFATRWCKEQGMRMHASGIQTPEAVAAWKFLATVPGCTVKRTYYKDKDGKRKARRYLAVKDANE